MLRTICSLGDSLFLHLSSDKYYIDIIYGSKPVYRVASQQKIIHYGPLQSLQRTFMEKNTVVIYYYVLVVDKCMAWTIYCVKSLLSEKPIQVCKGKFISEKIQLKNLVNVHQFKDKLLVVFDNFILHYVYLPNSLKNIEHSINKDFDNYGGEPAFEHQPFAFNRGFLPNQQDLRLKYTFYNKVSSQKGLLFLGYQNRSNGLNSIYTVQYYGDKSYFLSGKNILLNITGNIIDIFATEISNVVMVQTSQNITVWTIQVQSQQSKFETYDYKLTSCLKQYACKKQLTFSGVTDKNESVTIVVDKSTKKLKITPLQLSNIESIENLAILQIYFNPKSLEHFILSTKQEFYVVGKDGTRKIIDNQLTRIVKSHLTMTATHNFLIVDKQRGNQYQKVLFGNHLFTYQAEHYAHSYMLSSAKLINTSSSSDVCCGYLTSPLIGMIRINILLKKQAQSKSSSTKKQVKIQNIQLPFNYQINIDKVTKLLTEQTYFLNEKYQITQEEVIQFGKKSQKVAKLFQDATDFVSEALILSNELIILVIQQQIHVFDAKFLRKYIYCFNSEIKKVYGINDINVLGVQLYEVSVNGSSNQLTILILQQQKISKLKVIDIPDVFNYIQLTTYINTSEYKLNLFGQKLIISTNDSLHRYQIDKIVVEDFRLPLPESYLERTSIIPIVNFSKQKNVTDFLVIYRSQQNCRSQREYDNVQVYIGSFLSKYLLKKLELKSISINFQRILTLSQLPNDRILFATNYIYEQNGTKTGSVYRYLLLFAQKSFSVCGLKFGKIQLQWLKDNSYLTKQLQGIERISQKALLTAQILPISKPIFLLQTNKKQYFLIYNQREIYYGYYDVNKMVTISYYSLINDQYNTFRNNLTLEQLNDGQFISIFSQKMLIKDIKYLNDKIIFVLYEYCIVVLEVGLNNSLVVKQELKFRSPQATQIIKIEQFLQNYDQESIYMRQSHGRIYLLKKNEEGYKIQFHSYMDEEVLLFSRLNNWHKKDRTYYLESLPLTKQYEELILKKDGQLNVNSLEAKQQSKKLIYL